MASSARTLERQPLLVSGGTTYGSSNTISEGTLDPEEIARRFLEQAVRNAGPADSIAVATVQNTLQLPEGTYVGDILHGKPHGHGTLTYHPGGELSRYTGLWKEGKYHGNGILIYTNNCRHEGTFENGLASGQGTRYFPDRSTYVGAFLRDKMHGKGVIRFKNGDIYEGDWVNGNRAGQGKYIWRHGDVYTGGWKDSKKEGKGVLVKTDASRVEGVFKNDVIWEGSLNGKKVTKGGPAMDGIHRVRCTLLAIGIVLGLTIMGSGYSVPDATTSLVFYVLGGTLTGISCLSALIFRRAICNQPRDSRGWWSS